MANILASTRRDSIHFFDRFRKPEKNKHFHLETVYILIKDSVPSNKILEIEVPLPKTNFTNEKHCSFWDEFEEMLKKKRKIFSTSANLSTAQKLEYLNKNLGGSKSEAVLILYQNFVLLPPCEDDIGGLQSTFSKVEEILDQLNSNGENIDSPEIIKIWKRKFPIGIIAVLVRKHGNYARIESLRAEMKVQIDLIAESWEASIHKIIDAHLKAVKLNEKEDCCC